MCSVSPKSVKQGWKFLVLLKVSSCCIACILFGLADALSSTQIQSLLALQKLLERPSALNSWSLQTDFCNLPPSSSLNISCSDGNIIVLQIVGDKISLSVEQKFNANYTEANVRLSDSFSSDSLANAILKFPNLRVLSLVSLGIWGVLPGKLDRLPSLQVLNFSSNLFSGSVPQRFASLGSLEILALDNNILNGPFPDWLNVLPNLDTLYLSSNRFVGSLPSSISLFQNLQSLTLDHNLLTGQLPSSISRLKYLQLLSLSENMFADNIPNLGSLRNLQYLNLRGNSFGPDFPILGNQLVSVYMQSNKLAGPIPRFFQSFYNLQSLDLSFNSLSGAPPFTLFSLPSIRLLDLSDNQLSGVLPYNLSLGTALVLLDISSNFFTGPLPRALTLPSSEKLLKFQENCFVTALQQQQPQAYCQGMPTLMAAHSSHHVGLIVGVVSGVVAMIAVVAILLATIRSFNRSKRGSSLLAEHNTSGVQPELLSYTRYLSPVIKTRMTDIPQSRVFSLQQLEEMTHNFSQKEVLGEGQHGQVYKGWLEDGTAVAVKSMAVDLRQDVTQLQAHIELLLKIRHRNLVSLLGYCLEREIGQQNYWHLFLVSEFVDNGTLRSKLAKTEDKESLSWSQRLDIVVGAGKGIQHLHSGLVPGIFNNDVNTTNILLDQNLLAKVCDFGLAGHWQDSQGSDGKLTVQKPTTYIDVNHQRRKLGLSEMDVYNFGHVLLEIVLGKPATIENPYAAKPKIKELELLITDHVPRWDVIDSAVVGTCMAESLATVLDIAAKCLSEDISARPSMEDVVWNLQYAAQVQENVSRELSPPDTQTKART
ncbi:hypothetical protein O6H91_08G059600 [Diphasiastrum complanatum]|uniref:Uncharacterized protein n=1 Tax=Diphasiastrum complanatum TaxID=34168 RepID=A0ACC2CYE0_DIPCM|nr:hypothetical protein O6H91_08G059600 [Diphasiastrum complanatum]